MSPTFKTEHRYIHTTIQKILHLTKRSRTKCFFLISFLTLCADYAADDDNDEGVGVVGGANRVFVCCGVDETFNGMF